MFLDLGYGQPDVPLPRVEDVQERGDVVLFGRVQRIIQSNPPVPPPCPFRGQGALIAPPLHRRSVDVEKFCDPRGGHEGWIAGFIHLNSGEKGETTFIVECPETSIGLKRTFFVFQSTLQVEKNTKIGRISEYDEPEHAKGALRINPVCEDELPIQDVTGTGQP